MSTPIDYYGFEDDLARMRQSRKEFEAEETGTAMRTPTIGHATVRILHGEDSSIEWSLYTARATLAHVKTVTEVPTVYVWAYAVLDAVNFLHERPFLVPRTLSIEVRPSGVASGEVVNTVVLRVRGLLKQGAGADNKELVDVIETIRDRLDALDLEGWEVV